MKDHGEYVPIGKEGLEGKEGAYVPVRGPKGETGLSSGSGTVSVVDNGLEYAEIRNIMKELRDEIIDQINSELNEMSIEEPYNDEEEFWNDAVKKSRVGAVSAVFNRFEEKFRKMKEERIKKKEAAIKKDLEETVDKTTKEALIEGINKEYEGSKSKKAAVDGQVLYSDGCVGSVSWKDPEEVGKGFCSTIDSSGPSIGRLVFGDADSSKGRVEVRHSTPEEQEEVGRMNREVEAAMREDDKQMRKLGFWDKLKSGF